MTKQTFIHKLIQIISLILLIACICYAIYAWKMGIFKDINSLQTTISNYGQFGILLFIGIQILQVVIPIIPGGVTLVAGVTLFGPWNGFLYNFLGIIIGSLIAFLLARRYGKPFIHLFVDHKTYNKYENWLEEKNRFHKLFATAMLLPGLPDDFICMLAGLTKMSFTKFTVLLLLTKPATLLIYSIGGLTLGLSG